MQCSIPHWLWGLCQQGWGPMWDVGQESVRLPQHCKRGLWQSLWKYSSLVLLYLGKELEMGDRDGPSKTRRWRGVGSPCFSPWHRCALLALLLGQLPGCLEFRTLLSKKHQAKVCRSADGPQQYLLGSLNPALSCLPAMAVGFGARGVGLLLYGSVRGRLGGL